MIAPANPTPAPPVELSDEAIEALAAVLIEAAERRLDLKRGADLKQPEAER